MAAIMAAMYVYDPVRLDAMADPETLYTVRKTTR